MATSLEGIFTGMRAVEQERNEKAGLGFDTLADQAAMLAAYPPDELEANSNADTVAYDYERTREDGPHDWWWEAQRMVCRFIRQAHDQGLAPLPRDLEYVRDLARVS
jgi:hypothetical protein